MCCQPEASRTDFCRVWDLIYRFHSKLIEKFNNILRIWKKKTNWLNLWENRSFLEKIELDWNGIDGRHKSDRPNKLVLAFLLTPDRDSGLDDSKRATIDSCKWTCKNRITLINPEKSSVEIIVNNPIFQRKLKRTTTKKSKRSKGEEEEEDVKLTFKSPQNKWRRKRKWRGKREDSTQGRHFFETQNNN